MENTDKKKYDLYFSKREMEILENMITEETEKEFLYFIHKENCDNLNLKKNWKKIKRLKKVL